MARLIAVGGGFPFEETPETYDYIVEIARLLSERKKPKNADFSNSNRMF